MPVGGGGIGESLCDTTANICSRSLGGLDCPLLGERETSLDFLLDFVDFFLLVRGFGFRALWTTV